MTTTTLAKIDSDTDHAGDVRVREHHRHSFKGLCHKVDQQVDSTSRTAVNGRRSRLIEPNKLAKLTRSKVGVGIQFPITTR